MITGFTNFKPRIAKSVSAESGSLTKNYQGKVYYIRITEGDEPIIEEAVR